MLQLLQPCPPCPVLALLDIRINIMVKYNMHQLYMLPLRRVQISTRMCNAVEVWCPFANCLCLDPF
jgi:hypothetical protein